MFPGGKQWAGIEERQVAEAKIESDPKDRILVGCAARVPRKLRLKMSEMGP